MGWANSDFSTTSAGAPPRWAAARAIPFDAASVVERKPANITFKAPAGPIERTLRITSNKTLSLIGGGEPAPVSYKLDGFALESSAPDGKEPVTRSQLLLQRPRLTREAGGKVSEAPASIAGHVGRYINFYVASGNGTRVEQAKDFQGKLENVDVERVPGISHLTIDKNQLMQQKVIAEIDAAVRSGPARGKSRQAVAHENTREPRASLAD